MENTAPDAGDNPDIIHALPPEPSAFRRWFTSLHPSARLVLSQLWMPTFMCAMFILCYVGPFQHAAPRDVPVGVIGETQVVQTLQDAADRAEPGALAFEQVPDHTTAQTMVRRGELGMAYDTTTKQIILASAHQAQAASIFPRLLTPLFPAAGQQETPGTDDVAPLPLHDIGMTPMYLMLAWCISGYLSAMFIGLMGGPLGRRARFTIIVAVSAILSTLSAVLVDLVLGAVTGHFWALLGLGFCWSVAIGAAVNGLSYFVGRFIAAPSMVLFIFLSIPSSGAALPVWMMPELFQWLNHVVVGSGISEMLKRLVYGVGPGYTRGWVMMSGYLVAGLLLTWVGKPYRERKLINRLLAGRRTMFQDAQRAVGRKNMMEEKEILAAHGLAVREADGAILRITPVPVSHGHRAPSTSGGNTDDGADRNAGSAAQDAVIPRDDRSPVSGLGESLDPPAP